MSWFELMTETGAGITLPMIGLLIALGVLAYQLDKHKRK